MSYAVLLLSLLFSAHLFAEVSNEVFEGIAKIEGCSASLVKFKGQDPQGLALILTNDHCLDDQPYKTFTVNKPYAKTVRLFDRNKKLLDKAFVSTRLVYATQTHTDIGLLELSVSYAELEQRYNVRPLEIAENSGFVGDEILVITGYFSKAIECRIESFIYRLVESSWSWKNSYRYDSCETGHGTSGSPIVLRGTREVVGINNTGNDDGARCTLNNPCEVNEHGEISVLKGRHYGQQIHELYTCLDQRMKFDLKLPSCQLFGGMAWRDFSN